MYWKWLFIVILEDFEKLPELYLYDIFSWWLNTQPQVVQSMIENTNGKMLGRIDSFHFRNMYAFNSGESFNLPYISARICEKYSTPVQMWKLGELLGRQGLSGAKKETLFILLKAVEMSLRLSIECGPWTLSKSAQEAFWKLRHLPLPSSLLAYRDVDAYCSPY